MNMIAILPWLVGAAALGGEVKFFTSARQEFPDVFLAVRIIRGGVYEIDPAIQDPVQDNLRVSCGENPAVAKMCIAQFHCAITYERCPEPCLAEFSF
jgi:hypothetical protein